LSYVITAVLVSFNTFFAFGKKHFKFMAFMLLLFMWILFWANTMNPDYFNYMRLYSDIQSGSPVYVENGKDIGFRIIIKLGIALGLSYEFFLSLIVIFAFLLIHSTVKQFCKNYNYVYLLYFIFPFFLDVVQIRNFLFMALFVYATKFLIDNSKKSKIKYVIIISLASLIHIIGILYLPMVLIGVKKKNYLIRGIVLFSVLTSLIIVVNDKQIPYIGKLLIDNERLFSWISIRTNWGFLLFWLMQTLSFLIMYYSLSTIKKNIIGSTGTEVKSVRSKEINAIQTDKDIIFVQLVYWINLIAFIYFPFYIIASTFTRLLRNILLLNYVSFAIVSGRIKKRDKRLIFNMLVAIYVLFFFLIELYIPYSEVILDAILQNNSVFSL
jgi:hypothetical protein